MASDPVPSLTTVPTADPVRAAPPPVAASGAMERTTRMEVPAAEEFQTEQVLTVAGGHFVHDTFTAFLAPLLPLIQDRLAIGYAGAGALAIFTQLPSLLMPFIGYLADRVSLRYFVILAPGITATLMGMIGLAPNYVALAFLLVAAGVSIAAFHAPAPAMIARVSGKRVGTGMSFFMSSGELGRTVGPVVAVAAVSWWGLEGIWRLSAAGWLTSAVLYWRLRSVAARPVSQRHATLAAMLPQVRTVFGPLTWIMGSRAFALVALTTYLPIFMRDELNVSLWLAAGALTILEGAGVAGALATGTLSDTLGRRRVLLVLLTVSSLLMLVFIFGPLWLIAPVLVGLGLAALSPAPVLLAIVQDNFPNNRAVANGIFMFINFLVRALALWIVGTLADSFGLTTAFLVGGLTSLLAIPAVFFVPVDVQENDGKNKNI